jgi:hypothetical protein
VHMDPEQPVPGMGDGLTLESLPPAALDELLAIAGPGSRFPLLSVEVRHLGGELRRARPDGGALASIDAGYVMFAVGMLPVLEHKAPTEAQIRAIKGALTPWASRQMYFNFADFRRPVETFWDAETFAGLRRVKAAVDPDEMILSNHQIPPAR